MACYRKKVATQHLWFATETKRHNTHSWALKIQQQRLSMKIKDLVDSSRANYVTLLSQI